ncbi:MFS transporter [Kineosporia mesophila]|uniref:MFS transporter n=1 Tax=Kineosporia mesophila TaxID=566012 RepID=A0ABP7AMP7_9ACTN
MQERPALHPRPDRLPRVALSALALSVFIVIMTETLPAGLLPEIAADLGTSESAAGQLVSVYALATVLVSIPATTATRGWRRKPVLLLGIGGFLVANAVTAAATTYPLALAARFVAGGFSGLLWGMIAGYAMRIVPDELRGRALAVAMVGTPLALSLGTPLGSAAGAAIGWRWSFAAMSLISALLVAWIAARMPDAPGQAAETRTPLRRVLLIPGLRPVLLVVVTWMLAHNVLYTYISTFLDDTGTGLRTDLALFVFGVSALVGIAVTGALIDTALRRLVLGSLTGFALAVLVLAVAAGSLIALCAAIVVWGITFGGAATQLQTASADATGADADVAQSMVTTAWNAAIFGGGAIGGVLLDQAGPGTFPWAMLALVVAALVVSAVARTHAFPPADD